MSVRDAIFLLAATLAVAAPLRHADAQQAPVPAVADTDKRFVVKKKGSFNGVAVNYTATSEPTLLRDDAGQPIARFFSVAYTRDDADPRKRPVTFVWNGGPGSPSVWLHLGAFGPRRVDVPADAKPAGVAPYVLEDNASSLLDVTDLVFLDPVGSGFSIPAGTKQVSDFHNLIADADSFTRFIRAWLDQNGRANSPKFVIGESYGSVRAGPVVEGLARGREGKITLNGLILLGQDMDTTETQQSSGNDMPYVIYLPTYAAAAWYHGKIDKAGKSFEAFLQDARNFARTELQAALFLGSAVSPEERGRVAARMAALTGLPQALIEKENLRIGTAQFGRELLRAEGRVLIRSDYRYTVPATEFVHDEPLGDVPGVPEAYAAGRNEIYRRDLGIGDIGRPYVITQKIARWDYTLPDGKNNQQTYHNVGPYVATAMRGNPSMRLFIGCGVYDAMAAIHSCERTASHSGLPLERVTLKNYPTGHMIFLDKQALADMAKDLRQFIAAGL